MPVEQSHIFFKEDAASRRSGKQRQFRAQRNKLFTKKRSQIISQRKFGRGMWKKNTPPWPEELPAQHQLARHFNPTNMGFLFASVVKWPLQTCHDFVKSIFSGWTEVKENESIHNPFVLPCCLAGLTRVLQTKEKNDENKFIGIFFKHNEFRKKNQIHPHICSHSHNIFSIHLSHVSQPALEVTIQSRSHVVELKVRGLSHFQLCSHFLRGILQDLKCVLLFFF